MIELLLPLIHAWEDVRDFTESGGGVLLAIAVVIFVLWSLILERAFYQWAVFPRIVHRIQAEWDARAEKTSWTAHKIRTRLVSEARIDLERSIPLIKTLVAICPLLGLLGTVTGMVQVFDVMAITGTGNARSMAAGVSQATIPTMAGMVGALSGVFASSWIERRAKERQKLLEDHLVAE